MIPGPAPSGPKSTATRILDEAEIQFAEQGYQGTSLSQVADRVGIRGPSLFNHFKNKRELYEAVLDRLLAPFFSVLDELSRAPTSAENNRDAVAKMLEHHAKHPRLACLIQQAVLAGGDQLDWLIERWYAPFFASIPVLDDPRSAAPSPDLAALIMGFNSLILGYVTLAPLHERLLGLDPLAQEGLAAYQRFLRSL